MRSGRSLTAVDWHSGQRIPGHPLAEGPSVAITADDHQQLAHRLTEPALTPAPWLLSAVSAYFDANGTPQTPEDLRNNPSLFMMRTGVSPVWRLRRSSNAKDEVVIPLMPRLLCDDMIALKQAAITGLGVVALPGYVCREDVRLGALRRVLPAWFAGDSTITVLIPYRRGLLPSARAFVDHLEGDLPKAVLV